MRGNGFGLSYTTGSRTNADFSNNFPIAKTPLKTFHRYGSRYQNK